MLPPINQYMYYHAKNGKKKRKNEEREKEKQGRIDVEGGAGKRARQANGGGRSGGPVKSRARVIAIGA